MAANSMLSRLREAKSASLEENQEQQSKATWNKKRSRNLNGTPQAKSGWMKKRSRHLKQWRKRFAQIEENQYLCTYNNDSLKHCTEKIDMTQAFIYYTINKATQFQIYPAKKNTDFYFECDTVEDANEWLINLKKINESSAQSTNKNIQQANDLDLITAGSPRNDVSPIQPGSEQKVSDIEVNLLYMKAIGLYQHKFYPQCQEIIKSVLTLQPNHSEAIRLSEYLMNKQYDKVNDKKSKKNNSRRRFKTVSVTKTSSTPKKHKAKTKSMPQNKRHFSLWNKQNVKDIASTAADLTVNELKQEETDEAAPPLVPMHPCQLEFRRFITERIQLNKYYDDLIERFEMAKYDDIRFLKHFDKDTLRDEIGLRPLHVKCFLHKMEIFLNEVALFEVWLKQIVMAQKKGNKFNNVTSEGLADLFENNGITTFEALYRYIQSKEDLERIVIGEDELQLNAMVYDVIWNSMHHIEKKQRSRMNTVAQTYREINSAILGINDDEMYKFSAANDSNAEGVSNAYNNEKEGAHEETAQIAR